MWKANWCFLQADKLICICHNHCSLNTALLYLCKFIFHTLWDSEMKLHKRSYLHYYHYICERFVEKIYGDFKGKCMCKFISFFKKNFICSCSILFWKWTFYKLYSPEKHHNWLVNDSTFTATIFHFINKNEKSRNC